MTTEQGARARPFKVATWSALADRTPAAALVANVDLVVIRHDDRVSVLYGRCLHRGALMADGCVQGNNLICGVHGWDYRLDTGVSEYNNAEALARFDAWIDQDTDAVFVDADEVAAWELAHPQPYERHVYLGQYQDIHGTPDESNNGYIQQLARDGLTKTGHHGPASAMGVPLSELPGWDDIQIITAQMHKLPLMDDAPVQTACVIGPNRMLTYPPARSRPT